MLRQFAVATLAALLPVLIASPSLSVTGLLAAAIVVGVLIAVGSCWHREFLAASTNRRLTSYRRRDDVTVETLDPRRDPVRPRAPGLA